MHLDTVECPPEVDIYKLFERRVYTKPTSAEAHAIALSDDLLANWTFYASTNAPNNLIPCYAWDLRRRSGAERGAELYESLAFETDRDETIEEQFAASDRAESIDDQSIVQELCSLHHRDGLDCLVQSDDGEALRNELDALADRFDTIQSEAINTAFEPYRNDASILYQPLHQQFREFEQEQFARAVKSGKIPMPTGASILSFPTPPVDLALPLTFFEECHTKAPKAWIFKGVFAKGENSSTFGAPGTLKSAFLTDAVVHAAAGKDWRGFKNKEKCGVVYFAFERADQVKRRLTAYTRRDGLRDLPIAVAGNIVDMLNPTCVDIVVATIRAAEKRFCIPVGMITFDTWSKGIAAGGGDEDKARDQNVIAANLRRIHEQVTVHIAGVGHSGKDESRGERGSNARQGDVDLQIQITGTDVKTATVIKANDQPDGALTSFGGEVVALGVDEDGDPITAFILSTRNCTPPSATPKRNPRHDLSMDALHRVVQTHGEDKPGAGLTGRAVEIGHWRNELFSCGVIDSDAANPRADFKRIREALTVAKRITERDGYIWPIGRMPSLPPLTGKLPAP